MVDTKQTLSTHADSNQPPPVEAGDLSYHWTTNAPKDAASKIGEQTVSYKYRDGTTEIYQGAVIGPASEAGDDNHVGIYEARPTAAPSS